VAVSQSAKTVHDADAEARVPFDDVGERANEVELTAHRQTLQDANINPNAAAKAELRIRKPSKGLTGIAMYPSDQTVREDIQRP
jgi:hypothetical protein